MNEGSISDYIDLQRMMFMLNESYQSKSFSIFGRGAVAESFRQIIADYQVAQGRSVIERCQQNGTQKILAGVPEKVERVTECAAE
jgi:hypothetical protein